MTDLSDKLERQKGTGYEPTKTLRFPGGRIEITPCRGKIPETDAYAEWVRLHLFTGDKGTVLDLTSEQLLWTAEALIDSHAVLWPPDDDVPGSP